MQFLAHNSIYAGR